MMKNKKDLKTKFIAQSQNFSDLQALRGVIKDYFYVSKVKWGGSWNGLNWENFSFLCTSKTLQLIEKFCNEHKLEIDFIEVEN